MQHTQEDTGVEFLSIGYQQQSQGGTVGRTVQNGPQELHFLNVFEVRHPAWTNNGQDFLSKALQDFWMLAEEIDRKGERRRGLAQPRMGCQMMHHDVPLLSDTPYLFRQ